MLFIGTGRGWMVSIYPCPAAAHGLGLCSAQLCVLGAMETSCVISAPGSLEAAALWFGSHLAGIGGEDDSTLILCIPMETRQKESGFSPGSRKGGGEGPEKRPAAPNSRVARAVCPAALIE